MSQVLDHEGQARAVLGIDAAWTEREPSGVALIADNGSGWRLVNVSPSYAAFLNPDIEERETFRHRGSNPDAAALVAAAEKKAGCEIDLVAIDMPLSMTPIVGRRVSDNLISSAYGARHASTHTPSILRPGRLSDELRLAFGQIGYPLATTDLSGCAIIEVYPHPALIELASAERRMPYKHSKTRKYWPDDLPGIRREKLLDVWGEIVGLLDARISGVADALALPSPASRGYQMKAFEDSLDAVVCAWIGASVVDGRATAYGDADSAIWVPNART